MKRLVSTLIRTAHSISTALWLECIETKEMSITLVQLMITKDVSQDDINKAKAQLKDVLKLIPVTAILIIPVPGLTEVYFGSIIFVEKNLNIKTGLLPSQIQKLTKQSQKSRTST